MSKLNYSSLLSNNSSQSSTKKLNSRIIKHITTYYNVRTFILQRINHKIYTKS